MDDRVKDQSDETDEWLDALDSVEAFEGIGKVDDILDAVVTSARRKGAKLPFAANTAYVNTIAPEAEPPHPGDRTDRAAYPPLRALERRRDGGQGEQGILRARRPYCELPVGGDPLRHRLHAFLACLQRDAWRRPDLFPGP